MSEFVSLEEAAHNLEIEPELLQQWVRRGMARASESGFEVSEVQRLILEKHLILSQLKPEKKSRPKVLPPRSLAPEGITGDRDRRRRMGRRASDFTLELLHQEIRTAVAAALAPLQAQLEQVSLVAPPAADLSPELQRLERELAEARQLLERSESERHRWQLRLQDETAGHLEELRGQLQHLEEARESYREKLSLVHQEKAELQSLLEQERGQGGEASARLQQELDIERGRALQSQRELDFAREEQQRLMAELDNLRRELSQARSEDLTMDAERARWSLELRSLQGEVDRLNAVQAGWDEQKRELEQQIQQLRHKSEQQEGASQREQELEAEIHRLQELIKSLNYKLQMAGPGTSGPTPEDSRRLLERLSEAEAEMAQKNQLIQQNYAEISELGSKLDALQRAHYELQQRHERVKEDWSQLAAKQINELQQQQQQPPPSSLPSDRKGGWGGLFRMRGDS